VPNDYPPPDKVNNWEARNNNYGGIRRTDVPPTGPERGGFRSYDTPEEGVAAIVDLLNSYANNHKIDTLQGIISRWAPPNENPTQQLINNASSLTGFKPNEKLNLQDPETLSAVTEAMIRNEFGGKLPVHPYIINQVAQDSVPKNFQTPSNVPDYFTNESGPFLSPSPNQPTSDPVQDFLQGRGSFALPQPQAPSNAGAYPVGNAPGFNEGANVPVNINAETLKQKEAIANTSAVTKQNLRNAAEVFTKINSGVTIPAQSEAGRWLVSIGLDPKYFGMAEPQFAQEAKKSATLALYAAMKSQPSLVADMEARKFTSPEANLEPDALKNLIANSIYTLDYNTAWYKHMQDYMKGHNNNIYGYDPTTFDPDGTKSIKMLGDAYNSLPSFKGEKTGAIIGVPQGQTPPTTTPPPTTSYTTMQIPPNAAAIKHLQEHPELAPAFDTKYGEGSAAKVLGQGGR